MSEVFSSPISTNLVVVRCTTMLARADEFANTNNVDNRFHFKNILAEFNVLQIAG